MFKKYITLIFIFITLHSFSQKKEYLRLIEKVSIDSLKKYEYKLAGSQFSGRQVSTSYGLLSGGYISDCFKKSGLKTPFDSLKSYNQRFKIDNKLHPAENWAQNIIGILPGTNSRKKHIVITAHHDHMGVVDNEILYGADDNGSGISALIEISRIMADASRHGFKPKRTIVFISTDAEEKMMLGSDFYVNNPVIPLEKTYCSINFDMIGRIDSAHLISKNTGNYIYSIFKDTTNQVFNDTYLKKINDKYCKLELDEQYQKETKNIKPYSFITRSDHYPFMKKGIPFIWFFSGFHNDYHQTTDTPDKICYPELRKRIQYMLALILDLANK